MLNSVNAFRENLEQKSYFPWIAFFFVTIGTFMVNVDSSVLNVALPTFQSEFQTDSSTVQWVILIYLLIITGILPFIGKLSDNYGRKFYFMLGISIFTIGSLLCSFSDSIDQLVIFRGIQALGGSMIMGNVMSIVSFIFPKGSRGKALGFIGSIVAAGTIVGPSVGGFLIDHFSWRSIFYINIPLGLLSIIGSFALLPMIRSNMKQRIDYIGAALFFVSMTALLLYISNGNKLGWVSRSGGLLGVATVFLWIIFSFQQLKNKRPLINIALFKNLEFTTSMLVLYLSYVVMMFPSIILPLFLHHEHGMTAFQIGVLMMSQAIAIIVLSPVGGWLSDKAGPILPVIIGIIIQIISFYMLTRLKESTSSLTITVALVIFGVGYGLFTSPNNVIILESVPIDQTGFVGSLIATARNFGRVTGVALAILFLQVGANMYQTYTRAVDFVFYISFFLIICSVVITALHAILVQKEKKVSH